MKYISLIILINLGFINALYAHPVSFKNGYSLMSEFSTLRRETSFIFSPTWNTGIGVVLEDMNSMGTFSSLQASWLAKRWNLSDAQGNIYIYGGPGYFDVSSQNSLNEDSEYFYRYGIQADFETRSIYTMIKFTENRSVSEKNVLYNMLDLKLGFAPYLGNYNELNSWIILHVRSNTEDNEVSIIPTLRFYFNNFLWEIAQDLDGNSYLNFMTRF